METLLTTGTAQLLNKLRQRHQVRDAAKHPLSAQNALRITSANVCPLWRDRASGLIIDLQEKTHATSVVAFPNANELLSPEGMKRMRDPYKMFECG